MRPLYSWCASSLATLRLWYSAAFAVLAVNPFWSRDVFAYTELAPGGKPLALSIAGTSADKARLVELPGGALLAIWHAAAGPADGAWLLDGTAYTPRAIFVSTSADSGTTWSPPLDVSNTANATDVAVL